jgi:hypothetical protein
MWCIQVQFVTKDGYSIGLPTFYLDENVQGICNEEHAKLIARRITDPCHTAKEIHVVAVKV